MKLNLAYQPNRRTETLGLAFAKRIQDPRQAIHQVTYNFFRRQNPHSRLNRPDFWYGWESNELITFRPIRHDINDRFTAKDLVVR